MTVLDTGAFTVAAGEIVALLGANGAGKTSLMETILGFRPSRTIRLFGEDVSALAVERRVALGVGYVPERRRLFAGLTVAENLEASSRLPAARRRRRVEEMLAAFPMLGERPHARAWLLSGGQQQMLALARAMIDRPRLLLLDEPTVGLDVKARADILGHVRRLVAEDGIGVLWATHLLDEIRPEDDLVVLHQGQVLSTGKTSRFVAEAGAEDLRSAFTRLTGAGVGSLAP